MSQQWSYCKRQFPRRNKHFNSNWNKLACSYHTGKNLNKKLSSRWNGNIFPLIWHIYKGNSAKEPNKHVNKNALVTINLCLIHFVVVGELWSEVSCIYPRLAITYGFTSRKLKSFKEPFTQRNKQFKMIRKFNFPGERRTSFKTYIILKVTEKQTTNVELISWFICAARKSFETPLLFLSNNSQC